MGGEQGNITDDKWVEYIKEPSSARARRQLQCYVGCRHVRRGRTDPALSRSSKLPPFRRWKIHVCMTKGSKDEPRAEPRASTRVTLKRSFGPPAGT